MTSWRTAARLWSNVRVLEPDECWPWTGSTNLHRGAYGIVWDTDQRRRRPAHAVARELATGEPVPDGMCGLHTCDNPPCCNPRHIYWGTRRQNGADTVTRKRHPRGEARVQHKVTEAQVVEMRERVVNQGWTLQRAADEYGLDNTTVGHIVRGILWAHADGPTRESLGRGRPRRRAG